jgi:hypothetical protein
MTKQLGELNVSPKHTADSDRSMATALNDHCFQQPHWRLIAQGFDTEAWFNDNQAKGTGGILNPQPNKLATGNFYFRFASSSSSKEAQFGGGWWLDFENYKKVERFALDNHYSLCDAARLMLALPYEWTKVDVLVKALLTSTLKAYAGEGKPAQGAAKGSRWIPTQHIKIRQLYIPGLYVKGGRSDGQLYEKAFTSRTTTRLR